MLRPDRRAREDIPGCPLAARPGRSVDEAIEHLDGDDQDQIRELLGYRDRANIVVKRPVYFGHYYEPTVEDRRRLWQPHANRLDTDSTLALERDVLYEEQGQSDRDDEDTRRTRTLFTIGSKERLLYKFSSRRHPDTNVNLLLNPRHRLQQLVDHDMSENFISPGHQRYARACMVCSIVMTQARFKAEGCPNCPFLDLKGSNEAIENCTSGVYEGVISVADPKRSWVAKWQRIDSFVSGVYAMKVSGSLPEEVKAVLEDDGHTYIPRDGSNIETE